MLRINRLKVLIKATNKEYIFDESFNSGLNLLTSDDNTKGKSSVLIAIYYCLGVEEIIGGVNEKVLTSVYKTVIEDDNGRWPVLESEMFLEITNGTDVVTLYRAAKKEGRDTKLVTVYYSSIKDMYNGIVGVEDFYVHMQNAATNVNGFHTFLENFLGVTLPVVLSTDSVERKLYLQLIFAALFIEQKNGWSGIYSGMPYLAIKDSKKKVTEFILGLNTFDKEKRKSVLSSEESAIKEEWKEVIQEIIITQSKEQCIVNNIPYRPEIVNDKFLEHINICKSFGEREDIQLWIEELMKEHDELKTVRPKVIDNYDELQIELEKVEDLISESNSNIEQLQVELRYIRNNIFSLEQNYEKIAQDIVNNKDAQKLRDLGSEHQCLSFNGICPVCRQEISDSLLPIQHGEVVMSIEENIRHLTAQKVMLSYALESNRNRKAYIDGKIQEIRNQLIMLQRLAKSLRNDLYSVDEDLSETIIYKRMSISKKIDDLKLFIENIDSLAKKLVKLSERWNKLLSQKAELSKLEFGKKDKVILENFQSHFVKNLKKYRYTSISNITDVEISKDSYMPVIDKFDMKFDSSASDNIRAIWAYTLGLLQTSREVGGNHFGIIMLDEPGQHSIGSEDTKAFFDSISMLGDKCQAIVGITINNPGIRGIVEGLDNINVINVGARAFK